MKSVTNLVGILLILFGVVSLSYQGFTYTKQEQIAKIGDVSVTANTQKTIFFSPWLGGLSLVAGVVLIAVNRRSGK